MSRSTGGFFAIVVVFIAVAILALRPWSKTQPLEGLPFWRGMAFGLGVAALATQVTIFAFVYTRVGEDQVFFPRWSRVIFPLFWLSMAGIFAGRGSARWAHSAHL